MNESIGTTQSLPPVADNLEVNQGAQASEVFTKWVVIVAFVVFVVGGGLVLVKSTHEPTSQTTTPEVVSVPATPQPASMPKGKDFGL